MILQLGTSVRTYLASFLNLEDVVLAFCEDLVFYCPTQMSSFEDWKLAAINNTGKSIEVTSLPTNVEKIPGGVEVNLGYVLDGVSYFVAPEPYLGNKLTAYGSSLNYMLYYTASDDGKHNKFSILGI